MAEENLKKFYQFTLPELFLSLNSSEKGLTSNEAEKRFKNSGPNEIAKRKKITPLEIFIRQFKSFIVGILLAAIIISFLIGERLDAIVISIIVILNALFGFVQEYRAEKAIEALRKMTSLKAIAIRDGQIREVDSRMLVPGDIIQLEAGSRIPADSRLLKAASLMVDEASLTGESVPAKKKIDTFAETLPVMERKNMVFMGSVVTMGHARAIVCQTGMATEIGKIAEMVQEVEEKPTPLQEKLKEFGRWLGFVTIGICFFVFGFGILRQYIASGFPEMGFISEMFLASVALAVAAIPEGLPAIVTISLALGINRMVKRNALIRQLPAVETLGCTNVICSDKTGTLTKNEMTVTEIFVNGRFIKISGEGYNPDGKVLNTENGKDKDTLDLLFKIGALCNDASLVKNSGWELRGDPTEGALLVSARKAGLDKSILDERYPRINEIPFDSDRKLMTTIHKNEGEITAFVKGAPDIILSRCSFVLINGKPEKINYEYSDSILDANQVMADKALRVLGFAYRSLPGNYAINDDIESEMVFVGLQAMMDPPREEVREAIEKCKTAGIQTIMITGDHKLTAIAIASNLGIYDQSKRALSGSDIENITDEEFQNVLNDTVLFARVSPEHKVRILDSLKSMGHIVAMTGDGVNDAPALKKSDIGVAMGVSGTDVAKEASDMILTDDNFASIVNAVEEGRGIYSSIKQFVQYTLSSNLGEILVIFLAILIGWPLPLVAIQILWVNLLTDGLPGLALGLDPYSEGLMKKPPRKKSENIISREVIWNILIVGTVMAVGTLYMFYSYGVETEKAKTIAFTTLIFFQLFNVMTYRAKNFIFKLKKSWYLAGSVFISIIMQLAVIYTPLSYAFKTVPISLGDWAKILLVSSSLYLVLETRKFLIKSMFSNKF